MRDATAALGRLVELDLLQRAGDSHQTTRRFQAAMARAAVRMMQLGDDGRDLRIPIAAALVELLPECTVEEIVDLTEAMLPIEERALPGIVAA